MSRPSDSEIEIEFDMTLETFGVDLDRVWTHNSLDDSYLILDENYNCNFDPILQQDYI